MSDGQSGERAVRRWGDGVPRRRTRRTRRAGGGWRWVGVTLLAAWLGQAAGPADAKVIRLRNQTISTGPSARAAASLQAAASPVSGLFLVQFEGRFEEAWRSELHAKGVELLVYVPDDAFVARLSNAREEAVRALPFVRWTGPYRAEHKAHRGLQAVPGPVGALGPVGVLLSADATAAERAVARQAFQRVHGFSRGPLGTIVRGVLKPGGLPALAGSSGVLWVEPEARPRLYDEIASKIVGGDNPGEHATATQQLGYGGRGVVVAVADTGLNNGDAETMHADLAGRVDAFFHYGQLENAADEHSHGTHVAGIVAGDGATGETDENGYLYGLGVAPEAHLVVQRIFDADGNYEAPPSNETLTRHAVGAGAVIGSNSWGDDTQGRYDLSAAEFDALVRDADSLTPGEQPYILEFSAGNAGPAAQTIGSPAVAKNVIATGASQNDRPDFFIYADGPDAMSDFSSRGPAEDGRIKPDVVAPGTWIASLQSASATDAFAWLPISPEYQYQGGTSQSGPHVSGAAAVFVQYYRETHAGRDPSPALVKAALIDSADDLLDEAGTDPAPNVDEGWGRVNLANLIGSARRFEFVDQTTALTNSQVFEQRILVASAAEPLKVTLTYTDPPGFPGAIPALVNDLDLEVVGPDGAVYKGNQFELGESIANPDAADRVNNVEGVRLRAPPAGDYLVRVRAQNVVQDVHRQTGVAPRQDFALAVSGDLALPGVGVLALDRAAYAAPALVRLRLADFDLAGRASVSVQVRSDTEPQGEALALRPLGAQGVFTGSVATVVGPAAADGRLQIHDGDTIRAEYADAAPAAARTATARADLAPPVISAVSTTNRFSKAVVTWETDEPAQSVVFYGPSSSLAFAVTNTAYETSHQMLLRDAAPGALTRFKVASIDEAGNASTDDNQGRLYTVTAPVPSTVLVVDANVDPFGLFDTPVSTYTDALDAAAISYEVWDVASEGRTPGLDELRPFAVVMWRVPELSASLTATDIKNLYAYLQAGGGLFMASMELLSRLDESGFANFRQNVLHVESFDVDPGVASIVGEENLSLTSGIYADLDYSAYPDLIIIPPDLSDTFVPASDAAPVLFDGSTGRAVGVRHPKTGGDSAGRVVFFSFPLDTVPFEGPDPNNRPRLVQNLVSYLARGTGSAATLELDRASYAVPARPEIELADAALAGRGQLGVSVTTSLRPQAQSLNLAESSRPGVFRGTLALIPSNRVPSAGQYQMRDGDTVRVQYRDTARNQTVEVAAFADTSAPTVSGVAAEPEYSEALVSWTTSEVSDSLVQFGESTFLGRTAYVQDFTDSHAVSLTGLLPDRQYYYQVVSTDGAGNTTIDDNQGQFYTFRTLKPLRPPFTDDLEHGGSKWTVVNDELDAETSALLQGSAWQLGRPGNELASSAHSGSFAWGTNLPGEPNDYANTSLVSPALELTGGNLATLRFWHNYDFNPRSEEGDLLEMGGVYVTTNNGALWLPLAEYGDASAGWEQEQLDLTPYAGRVVRLGWAYALFSMDAVPHPGWLVDDVSVTVSTVQRGAIAVSNNLAQARFRLSGPVSQSGSGASWTLASVPPGTYVLQFDPVEFYTTPAAQTNTLTGTNTLVFRGQYTFPDANANLLSDLWELKYFGEVAPNRPAAADSDGDGASDYAEFMAGTSPTDPSSRLRLEPPVIQVNRTVRLQWTAVVGHAYRVLLSTDLLTWQPASAWVTATQTDSSLSLPPLSQSDAYFFRLEVQP